MKKFLVLAWLTLGLAHAAEPPCKVSFYAYDTLTAPEGWATAVVALFAERYPGCVAAAIPVGDSGQLISRLALDARAGKSPAQLVIGLDQQVWEKVRQWTTRARGIALPPLRPEAESAGAGALFGQGFIPFDYGVFALMWDSASGIAAPTKWEELLAPQWKRKLLLQDPRASTPGLAFVLGSREAFGARWAERARVLAGQWLTLTPSWDQAYGMFLKGAAPLVWSYTTSQAYHVEYGKTDAEKQRYRAVVFEDGNPVQIEGAALVTAGLAAPGAREAAEKLLKTMLSKEAQELVARKNWMFPVSDEAKVPESFTGVPKPKRILQPSFAAAAVDRALKEWLPIAQRQAKP